MPICTRTPLGRRKVAQEGETGGELGGGAGFADKGRTLHGSVSDTTLASDLLEEGRGEFECADLHFRC
jgi:hypothetical protein